MSTRAVSVVRRVVGAFFADRGMAAAAAVAFYLVLSIPPLLISFTSIAVLLVGQERAEQVVSEQFGQFLPAQRDIVRSVISRTIESAGAAALVAIIFLLISGSRVFASLVRSIHAMWNETEPPGFIRQQVYRVVLLLVSGGLLVVAVALNVAVGLFGDALGVPVIATWLVRSQILPLLLVFAALLVTYRLVPRRRAGWGTAAVGAATGAVALRAAQFIFSFALSTFGNFRTAYGPLAGIAVLMTWALVVAAIMLVGAELVAVLNRGDSRADSADHGNASGGQH